MNPWGQSIQRASNTFGTALDEMSDLKTLFKREFVEPGAVSETTIRQFEKALGATYHAIEQTALLYNSVADAQRMATLTFLAGNRLTRDQFYILLASEYIEWTNKHLGLSDFEDFELIELMRYVGKDRKGYIYLGDDINEMPEDDDDDWYMQFLSTTYRKAIIPPEEIRWNDLQPEQRGFFEKYRPDVVDRFIHE
jgi:hypothetical protein